MAEQDNHKPKRDRSPAFPFIALRRAVGALRGADALPDGTRLPRLALRVDLVAVEPNRGSGTLPAIRHHRAIAV